MLTPACTYNFSIILPKRFHNHIGSRGRKQCHFETYFGHKGYKKLKIVIFMRNFHYHQKYPFGAQCRRPRALAVVFKNYPTYFQSGFITIYVRADADSIILKRILVTKTMKKLKIDIFMRNFHYHQKY